MKSIDQRFLSYKMTMYINIFVNHQTKKITVKPCLFSLNFNDDYRKKKIVCIA